MIFIWLDNEWVINFLSLKKCLLCLLRIKKFAFIIHRFKNNSISLFYFIRSLLECFDKCSLRMTHSSIKKSRGIFYDFRQKIFSKTAPKKNKAFHFDIINIVLSLFMYILSFQFVPHARIINIKNSFCSNWIVRYYLFFQVIIHHPSCIWRIFGILKIFVTFIFVELFTFLLTFWQNDYYCCQMILMR